MKTNLAGELQILESVGNGTLQVDDQGRIWRVKKRGWDKWKGVAVDRPCKRVRAEHTTPQGYLQIRVMVGGVRAYTGAHRLVYRVLAGDIPLGMTVNHKNGVKSDNRPENLEIATYSEQAIHSMRVLGNNQRLLSQDGEKNHAAKLTDAQVNQIRLEYADSTHVTQAMLAAKYGVRFQTISKIVRGGARRRQDGPTADYTYRRKYNQSRS